MLDGLKAIRGVIRSLRIYYGDRQHGPAMDQLYRGFVRPGDLAFDIGAHVGDRIAAFRRLGVRVVAVEPQPALAKTLRLLYGRDPQVTIEAVVVGRHVGTIELNLNLDNPTVSTVSTVSPFSLLAPFTPPHLRYSLTSLPFPKILFLPTFWFGFGLVFKNPPPPKKKEEGFNQVVIRVHLGFH